MDSFNNNDPFKQLVKSKLADYKHEAPPTGWEELERSLIAAQKTKVIHTKWIASSVAAVAAALIGVFFLFLNTSEELLIQTAKEETEQQEKSIHKEVKPLITKQNAIEANKSSTSLFTDNVSSLQEEASIISTTNEQENSLRTAENSVYYQEKEEVEPTNNESSKDKNRLPDIDEERKQQMIQEFINEGKRSYDLTDDTKTTKDKSKYAISLTGQSGFTSSQQTNTLPTTLRSSLNDSYGNYTMGKMQAYTQEEEEEVNPESETNHKQPISFGILTSFNLTRRMQIETGLIYTYLSSETKNMAEDFNNAEKAQFHYLGIPINLNYTLLSVNKLNVFVTAGAMIEKDIYGKIKYSDEKIIPSLINSGYANKTSSKINQKNPQLSVAGGVGITYPLYNKTSLFGKIGGRYYIKANNEYKTYYSDEKLSLDIQLGLKFNF